jgi:hypothetical protein
LCLGFLPNSRCTYARTHARFVLTGTAICGTPLIRNLQLPCRLARSEYCVPVASPSNGGSCRSRLCAHATGKHAYPGSLVHTCLFNLLRSHTYSVVYVHMPSMIAHDTVADPPTAAQAPPPALPTRQQVACRHRWSRRLRRLQGLSSRRVVGRRSWLPLRVRCWTPPQSWTTSRMWCCACMRTRRCQSPHLVRRVYAGGGKLVWTRCCVTADWTA